MLAVVVNRIWELAYGPDFIVDPTRPTSPSAPDGSSCRRCSVNRSASSTISSLASPRSRTSSGWDSWLRFSGLHNCWETAVRGSCSGDARSGARHPGTARRSDHAAQRIRAAGPIRDGVLCRRSIACGGDRVSSPDGPRSARARRGSRSHLPSRRAWCIFTRSTRTRSGSPSVSTAPNGFSAARSGILREGGYRGWPLR